MPVGTLDAPKGVLLMKYISCFSGIEAASVAVEKAGLGWNPVAFSEIDKFASAVLAHRYPQVPNLGDITKIDWSDYAGTVGLVCGGSPCQAFSVAGLRKSLEDPRGNLTIEYMRAVHQIKPRWVVWEQVPGVMSASGNPLGCFMAGLAGYDSPIAPPGGRWGNVGFLPAKDEQSYSIAYRILDAQHFGVPQRRRRIFLVGHLGVGNWWKPLEVLLERDREGRDFATGRKAWKTVAGDAGNGAAGVGSHWDDPANPHPSITQSHNTGGIGASNQELFSQRGAGLVMAHGQGGAEILEGQSPTLTCNHEAPIFFAPRSPDGAPRSPDGAPRIFDATSETLNTAQGGQRTPCVAFAQNQVGELRIGDVANTLGTTGNASARATGKICAGSIVRRITPTEAERLQGFPDNHTRISYRGKSADLCPDGPRYKALGNSWAVPVAQWVFERIDRLDKIDEIQ